MEEDFAKLIGHYATVTDGTSALLRDDLISLCATHGVTLEGLTYEYSRYLAEKFISGEIDFDTAEFAVDDLFWASDCSLSGFALAVFDAFDSGVATAADLRKSLEREIARHTT